jgi:hypothetical protein
MKRKLTKHDWNKMQINPGDIDHDFTDDVNRRQKLHRLAQFCWRVAKAVPYVAAGWFAHGFWY